MDEFYAWAFVRPAYWLGETFSSRWLDQGLLDGILNGLAGASAWIGRHLRNWIDLPVINGFGDWVGEETKSAGGELRYVQTGRVQQYLLIGMIFTTVVMAYILLTGA